MLKKGEIVQAPGYPATESESNKSQGAGGGGGGGGGSVKSGDGGKVTSGSADDYGSHRQGVSFWLISL